MYGRVCVYVFELHIIIGYDIHFAESTMYANTTHFDIDIHRYIHSNYRIGVHTCQNEHTQKTHSREREPLPLYRRAAYNIRRSLPSSDLHTGNRIRARIFFYLLDGVGN